MNTQTSRYRLPVNAYDRVSSVLLSLLIIVGVTVAGLLVVYFARTMNPVQVSIPVTPVDTPRNPLEAAMGLQRTLEPPGVEDVPELLEPSLEDTLDAITNAVSDRLALVAESRIDVATDVGHGKVLEDMRRPGPPTDRTWGGDGRVPYREVRFEPQSVEEYAEWLDFFGIEIGVLGRDNKVHYAYNLTKEVPDVRVGEPTDEQRLYMNPARGQFEALDRNLAEKAGIADRGRIILQFYPPAAEALLLDLEKQRADGRPTEQIKRTIYRVTNIEGRFEFSVEEQSYY